MRIEIDDLSKAILEELESYSSEVLNVINSKGKDIAERGADKLKASSPRRTRRYAESWTYSIDRAKNGGKNKIADFVKTVIHAEKPLWRLTHLL